MGPWYFDAHAELGRLKIAIWMLNRMGYPYPIVTLVESDDLGDFYRLELGE
jgi:hypothetical protein